MLPSDSSHSFNYSFDVTNNLKLLMLHSEQLYSGPGRVRSGSCLSLARHFMTDVRTGVSGRRTAMNKPVRRAFADRLLAQISGMSSRNGGRPMVN